MKYLLRSIANFLINGEIKYEKLRFSTFFSDFFLLLTVSFTCLIIITIFSQFIFYYFDIPSPKNNTVNLLYEKKILYVLFFAGILGPIVEEITFRLILNYSLVNISTFFSILLSKTIAYIYPFFLNGDAFIIKILGLHLFIMLVVLFF